MPFDDPSLLAREALLIVLKHWMLYNDEQITSSSVSEMYVAESSANIT
jgi:hypothetical protein